MRTILQSLLVSIACLSLPAAWAGPMTASASALNLRYTLTSLDGSTPWVEFTINRYLNGSSVSGWDVDGRQITNWAQYPTFAPATFAPAARYGSVSATRSGPGTFSGYGVSVSAVSKPDSTGTLGTARANVDVGYRLSPHTRLEISLDATADAFSDTPWQAGAMVDLYMSYQDPETGDMTTQYPYLIALALYDWNGADRNALPHASGVLTTATVNTTGLIANGIVGVEASAYWSPNEVSSYRPEDDPGESAPDATELPEPASSVLVLLGLPLAAWIRPRPALPRA